MYKIASNEINSFNGLGDGEWGADEWMHMFDTTLNTVNNMYTTYANAKTQQSQNASNSSGTIVGGNPSTYSPTYRNMGTNTGSKKEEETDYLPWIIGGGLALVALVLIMNKKK